MRFILLILPFLLLSCGTFKKVTHTTKRDSTSTTVTDIVDTRTITETIDTTIATKPATITTSTDLDSILTGKDIEIATPTATTEIHFDKKTRKVSTRTVTSPTIIPVHAKRVIQEQTHTKSKQVVHTKSNEKVVDKEHTSIFSGWWFYSSCILLLIILLIIARKLLKKYFKWIP